MIPETRVPSELETLLADKGITIDAKCIQRPLAIQGYWSHGKYIRNTPSKANWEDTAFHWTITLTHEGRKITTPYKCGFAHCKWLLPETIDMKWCKPTAPSIADVVYSLILDNEACEMSHDDWCANNGYDTDSRKGLELYLDCQKSGELIRKLLPSDLITECRNSQH